MQALLLNNERFLVPELAFHPSDIGLRQGGMPELVAQAALSQRPELQVCPNCNALHWLSAFAKSCQSLHTARPVRSSAPAECMLY